jgi:ribosomal protein S18 acetylase RimI-like enzyme
MIIVMDIQVRKATKNDYKTVDKLMCKLHNIHANNRPDLYQNIAQLYTYGDYIEKLKEENLTIFVASNGDEIAGICIITFRISTNNPAMVSSFIAYIDGICVSDEYQGLGVGSKLYQYAKQLAEARGAKRLELMAWDFNKNALEFYKHKGMKTQRLFLEVNL